MDYESSLATPLWATINGRNASSLTSYADKRRGVQRETPESYTIGPANLTGHKLRNTQNTQKHSETHSENFPQHLSRQAIGAFASASLAEKQVRPLRV